MALMDPYGIDLFGVQGWGFWFAVASTGFFIGGAVVAKRGIGKNPIRTILLVVIALGVVGRCLHPPRVRLALHRSASGCSWR